LITGPKLETLCRFTDLRPAPGIGVSRFNTVLRSICTLAVVLAVAQGALGQSVLNFPGGVAGDGGPSSVAVTNASSYIADVQFTFFNADGSLGAGPINPVSYRVPAKGQIAMKSAEIFGGVHGAGWVQATSTTSGLQGFYFIGDTRSGGVSATALGEQIIPFVKRDLGTNANVEITNPGSQTATGRIISYNARGDEINSSPINLKPHEQVFIPLVIPGAAARISTSAPVLASAVVDRQGSLMLVNGQPIQVNSGGVIPQFTSGNGWESTVVLTNPTTSPVTATVTLFSTAADGSSVPRAISVTVPANGSVTRDSRDLTASVVTPVINGWVRIDAAASALAAMVLIDSGSIQANVPMQTAPSDHILFSRTSDDSSLDAQLALIPTNALANLILTLSRPDGATLAQVNTSIAANSKRIIRARDLLSTTSIPAGAFITIRSSFPLYAVEMVSGSNGLAAVTPEALSASFAPSAVAPVIARVRPGLDVISGGKLQVNTANTPDNVSFVFGSQITTAVQSPLGDGFSVDVPKLEPGFVNLKLRVNGVDTDSVMVRVLDADGLLTQTLSGRAFYQKVAVTDSGLDTTQTSMVPIRSARVEVFDKSQQAVVSVSETDANGRFTVAVPNEPDLTIRVWSRLRMLDLRVVDNTNGNLPYSISADVDMREPPLDLTLYNTDRNSGAFNILEAVERGNDLVLHADPRSILPAFTIFWSVKNTNKSGNVAAGLVGGTYFNLSAGTAYILGDRATDSDEFDDSVIIHEYAHMLAVKFSRDDSPGSAHVLGDMLDPRVAWSEGFANFFSSAARNDAIYRDSYGPNGINLLRYDLDDNAPAGDRPGYWSEASVESLLWDLFHDTPDESDPSIQFDISSIWAAFTDLRNDHFVYLPYFLDHFLARNPESVDVVRSMAMVRNIQFLPGQIPSVAIPFPRSLIVGQSVERQQVDSLTTKRTNLMTSSHFFMFTAPGGPTGIRLDITGLGTGNNPNANDLDLYLLDMNGRIIDKSNSGGNGVSELISQKNLAPGTYVIEVRSYYTVAGTSTVVYNSGEYSLKVNTQ
jgi:hypothetical protein